MIYGLSQRCIATVSHRQRAFAIGRVPVEGWGKSRLCTRSNKLGASHWEGGFFLVVIEELREFGLGFVHSDREGLQFVSRSGSRGEENVLQPSDQAYWFPTIAHLAHQSSKKTWIAIMSIENNAELRILASVDLHHHHARHSSL